MSSKKILAVDDEPSICKLVQTALTGRGYEVIVAHNGEEALDKVALEHPDLVVLDIMMPKMDGREARRRLAKDPKTKGIPVIFLSAVGDLDSQLDALEESPDVRTEYLTKPFNPGELSDLVDAMLDPSKAGHLKKHRAQHEAQLRKLVEIMHRPKE
jgi:two-component system cell cycle response regulator